MKSSYKNYHVTHYTERSFNLLYLNVHPTHQTGGFGRGKVELDRQTISNIAIYDYAKDKITYLFDKNENKRILRFFFEKSYKEQERIMEFNPYGGNLINNQNIEKREPANCLFIVAEGQKKETLEFWKCSKTGENKQLVKIFEKNITWNLDVYNRKILFLQALPHEVKVEAFDW